MPNNKLEEQQLEKYLTFVCSKFNYFCCSSSPILFSDNFRASAYTCFFFTDVPSATNLTAYMVIHVREKTRCLTFIQKVRVHVVEAWEMP